MFQDVKPVEGDSIYFGTGTPQLPEATGSRDQVWQQVSMHCYAFV